MDKLLKGRRTIRFRNTSIAIKTAQWLAYKAVRPNQISLLSIVFSFFAALCLVSAPYLGGSFRAMILITSAIFIIFRPLCNLFDGMLAIEGGAAGKSGEIYNDLPDRASDVLIFVAMGYATTVPGGITLGWLAATLAVMTAYVRLLGSSVGSKQHFIGPMAKQHRMALVIIACFLSSLAGQYFYSGWIFFFTLSLISLGSLLTIVRRLKCIVTDLEKELLV